MNFQAMFIDNFWCILFSVFSVVGYILYFYLVLKWEKRLDEDENEEINS